jgi:azurin
MLLASIASGLVSVALLSTPAPADQAKPAAGQAKPAAGAARTIEITGGDDMKYNVTEITAKAGETIKIRLTSKGTLPKVAMAHNVVVLKSGAKQLDFVNAAAMARATDFIPADMKDQVLAATGLAGPGESVEITFKVPAAGSYPFMCTFPGHFAAGMKGTLIVK